MRNNGHEPSHSQPIRMETSHTTKATRYIEEEKMNNPEEEVLEEHKKHDETTNRMRHGENNCNSHNQGGKRQTETKTLRPDEIMSMVARGEITQEEAEERFEELGRKFQEKLTREAILDMMESGHLTMEESEVELRELESRERKNNKTPVRKIPEEKWKKHATIVPSMCKKKHARSTWREWKNSSQL